MALASSIRYRPELLVVVPRLQLGERGPGRVDLVRRSIDERVDRPIAVDEPPVLQPHLSPPGNRAATSASVRPTDRATFLPTAVAASWSPPAMMASWMAASLFLPSST